MHWLVQVPYAVSASVHAFGNPPSGKQAVLHFVSSQAHFCVHVMYSEHAPPKVPLLPTHDRASRPWWPPHRCHGLRVRRRSVLVQRRHAYAWRGTSGGGTSGGSTAGTRISAAAGGTVADPSGKTSLVIPPGALAQDTDITLAILPKSGNAVTEISELGPNGLTFRCTSSLRPRRAPRHRRFRRARDGRGPGQARLPGHLPSARPPTLNLHHHQPTLTLRLDEVTTGHTREYAADIQRKGYQTKPYIAYVRTILRAAVDSGRLDGLPDFPPGLMRSSQKLPDAHGSPLRHR